MSLATWKKEFYPVDAQAACKDRITAIVRSLCKWRGLMPSALRKHKMTKQEGWGEILGNCDCDAFWVDEGSCALCFNYKYDTEKPMCSQCPIYMAIGHSCDDEEGGNIYGYWVTTGGAKPMIRVLEQALIIEQAKEKARKIAQACVEEEIAI
jgi:hypothetical protein